MRLRVAVFGTLGLFVTGFGLALFTRPALVMVGPVETIVDLIGERDPAQLLLGTTALAGLVLLVAAHSSQETARNSTVDELFEGMDTTPPEAVTADNQHLVGEQLNQQIQYGIESGGKQLRDTRDWLATAAVHAAIMAGDHTYEEAKTAVEQGTWTDDKIAAAFLAGPTGPSPTLASRLRLWLAPARERRRRIERTMTAIERVRG